MTTYRVSIYATYEVEADSEEQACDMAKDAIAGQEIRTREFEFIAEETD
jgi:hypothetical protein